MSRSMKEIIEEVKLQAIEEKNQEEENLKKRFDECVRNLICLREGAHPGTMCLPYGIIFDNASGLIEVQANHKHFNKIEAWAKEEPDYLERRYVKNRSIMYIYLKKE